jgi:hypothetical protein
VAAVYDYELYVAQVEGREPEGYTLLKYMERKGNNQFGWGSGKDTLKTIVYCGPSHPCIIKAVGPAKGM